MTTKEVAQICGVTDVTIRNAGKTIGKVFENGKPTEWTEDELKKVQLVLMKNQVNQGRETNGGAVESNLKTDLQVGLVQQAVLNTGDMEAVKQYCELVMKQGQAIAEQRRLESENKLLLEQKEAAEAETNRIIQCNKNFHENLYTATELANELGTTANHIGRIANKNNLKQDPIWGKLGKVQLNNGKWVNQFYYNEDAKIVILNNL